MSCWYELYGGENVPAHFLQCGDKPESMKEVPVVRSRQTVTDKSLDNGLFTALYPKGEE